MRAQLLDVPQHLAAAAYGQCDQLGFRYLDCGFRDDALPDSPCHVEVDQQGVGTLAASLIERTADGSRDAGQFDIRFLTEQVDERVPQFRVVGDDKHPEPAVSARMRTQLHDMHFPGKAQPEAPYVSSKLHYLNGEACVPQLK